MADIVAPEDLPGWHIECKGTKNQLLERSKLQSWYAQIVKDCPANLLPVVINKSNFGELLAIMPLAVWRALKKDYILDTAVYNIVSGDSFNPTEAIRNFEKQEKIERFVFGRDTLGRPIAFLFDVETLTKEMDILVIVSAAIWLEYAKLLEARKKEGSSSEIIQ